VSFSNEFEVYARKGVAFLKEVRGLQ
jgi:hypothetical protein